MLPNGTQYLYTFCSKYLREYINAFAVTADCTIVYQNGSHSIVYVGVSGLVYSNGLWLANVHKYLTPAISYDIFNVSDYPFGRFVC